MLLLLLFVVTHSHTHFQMRSTAFIYLKNLTKAKDDNVVLRASEAVLDTVKTSLLQSFESESDEHVRLKLLYCLCAYAGMLVPLRKWDNFFPALFVYARSSDVKQRELSLRVVAVLTRDLTGFMRDNLGTMLELLTTVLHDGEASVRAVAIDVYSAFLVFIDDDNLRETLSHMMPTVLGGIVEALRHGHEEAAQVGIDALTQVAESDPLFLKRHST